MCQLCWKLTLFSNSSGSCTGGAARVCLSSSSFFIPCANELSCSTSSNLRVRASDHTVDVSNRQHHSILCTHLSCAPRKMDILIKIMLDCKWLIYVLENELRYKLQIESLAHHIAELGHIVPQGVSDDLFEGDASGVQVTIEQFEFDQLKIKSTVQRYSHLRRRLALPLDSDVLLASADPAFLTIRSLTVQPDQANNNKSLNEPNPTSQTQPSPA